MNLNNKTSEYLGRFSELLATLYMMQKGYLVYQIGNANKNHDLICEDADGKLISVQVKSSSNRKVGVTYGFSFRLVGEAGFNKDGSLIGGIKRSSKKISTSNIFLFICYVKESGNFYIYEHTNKYIKDKNCQVFWMNINNLHINNLFITKKIPDFSDDFDEDFEIQIPLLWDLVPLVQVNRPIEAA